MRRCILILGLFLVAPGPVFATTPTQSITREINQYRQSHGRRVLVVSTRLSQVALQRAKYMVATNRVGHTLSRQPSVWAMIHQTGYSFTTAGEVIAVNMTSPTQIVRAWKLSTAHNQQLLRQPYNQIGVAQVSTKRGQKVQVVTIVLFAAYTKTTP